MSSTYWIVPRRAPRQLWFPHRGHVRLVLDLALVKVRERRHGALVDVVDEARLLARIKRGVVVLVQPFKVVGAPRRARGPLLHRRVVEDVELDAPREVQARLLAREAPHGLVALDRAVRRQHRGGLLLDVPGGLFPRRVCE